MARYESPAKRPRVQVENDAVLLLGQAITTSQRIHALENLFAIVDYDFKSRSCRCNPQVFLSLIESKIVQVILLQLGFILNRHGSSSNELDLTCTALDIFYRFHPELLSQQSLQTKGPEVFRLLARASQRGVVLPVLSIWHSCSSKEYGASMLLVDSFVQRSILEILQSQPATIDSEVLMEILGLLKNLTYFSETLREALVMNDVFMLSLINTPESAMTEKTTERLSAVLRNLVLSPRTRKYLAQHSFVLTSLIRIANHANVQTLRNILNTIVSLSMDTDSCLLLVLHGDGMLVNLLKHLLTYEYDPTVRKRSAKALKLMARDTTISLLMHNNMLIETLSHVAMQDLEIEVRNEAAEAFARCAGLMKGISGQHGAALEALSKLANSNQISSSVVARAILEQANHAENRAAMARKPALLSALARIGMSSRASSTTEENICSALLALSDDENNREIISTPDTLEVLVHNAGNRSEGFGRPREVAVRVLLNLATIPSNRKKMALQSSLIQSLLGFASITTSNDLKQRVKSVLVRLATEL